MPSSFLAVLKVGALNSGQSRLAPSYLDLLITPGAGGSRVSFCKGFSMAARPSHSAWRRVCRASLSAQLSVPFDSPSPSTLLAPRLSLPLGSPCPSALHSLEISQAGILLGLPSDTYTGLVQAVSSAHGPSSQISCPSSGETVEKSLFHVKQRTKPGTK